MLVVLAVTPAVSVPIIGMGWRRHGKADTQGQRDSRERPCYPPTAFGCTHR
jgi:hypothetical protein